MHPVAGTKSGAATDKSNGITEPSYTMYEQIVSEQMNKYIIDKITINTCVKNPIGSISFDN